MIVAKSLPQVLAEEEALLRQKIEELAALEQQHGQKKDQQVVQKLAVHIEKVWEKVKRDNRQVRREMIRILKRVRGEYDSQKLTDIRAFKGSEVYVRSAESKCRAAYSWITDIYRGDNELPFTLEPTASPELPDTTKEQIKQEIIIKGIQLQEQMLLQSQQSGAPFDKNRMIATLNEWQEVAERKAAEQIQKTAKERCDKALTMIRDANQQGGWDEAFKDFIWWFVRVKAGILKGPVLVEKKEYTWDYNEETGVFDFVTKSKLGIESYCVNPFNFYPSQGMRNVNDGDTIEIHELTKESLIAMKGVPGYDEDEIDAVISEINSGKLKGKWLTIDDETEIKSVSFEKTATNLTYPTATTAHIESGSKIQAIEMYGSVSGKMLIEWGAKESGIKENEEYQANCWKIGTHVIKAVLNPDKLGRKPYHVSSWAKSPLWILGEGLIEFAEPIEDILNSIARALQNNIAIASGPQVEQNVDRCDDKTPLYPWKKWLSTTSQMKDGPALQFWQPQMHVQELIAAYTFFSKLLDEMTVPAYAQGASQSGVTAGTATVFTELLAAASRSIKGVVANIDDDVVTPYNEMCYDVLMENTQDQSLKGDAHVVAKGVSRLLAKEQQAQRKVEYLQVVANPTFAQTLGAKNIGYILAQIAKSNDLKLPDMDRLEGSETLESLLTKMNMQAAGVDPMQSTGQIGAGGTPTAPQATTMTGAPAGAPQFQQPAQMGA